MIVPNDVVTEFNLVFDEFKLAKERFSDFNSVHEGYAVILEELDELWNEVKKDPCGSREVMKKEASHVAAMAIRFLTDLCG